MTHAVTVNRFAVLRAMRAAPAQTDVIGMVDTLAEMLGADPGLVRRRFDALIADGAVVFACVPGLGCCESGGECRPRWRVATPDEHAVLRARRDHPAGKARIIRVRTERKRSGGIRRLPVASAPAEPVVEVDPGPCHEDWWEAWIVRSLQGSGRLAVA